MKTLKSALYPTLQKARYAKLIKAFEAAKKQPMNENGVVMLSTSKGKLGGNLKAVYDYLGASSLPYEVKVFTNENLPAPGVLGKELAAAKFIMVDDYEPMVYPLTLRSGQHLVQVWHALGAFKRFGYARETAEKNSLTHKNYTEAIVSSPELKSLYASSFGISEDKIIPVGAPRTDLFFDEEYKSSAKARLYEKEPRLENKKVILFAPTFRGDSVNNGSYPEEFFSVEELMKDLTEEWALIIKLHPYIRNKIAIPEEYKNRVFDFSSEREINDILLITNVLITDYSSVIYENAIIGGACVHYVPDLEEYENGRGFYFPYSDYVCGETVKNKDSLARAVLNAKADDERMLKFKDRFVSLCDGKSCERFVKMIMEDR